MKDILITSLNEKEANIIPQTDKAKEVFKDCDVEGGMYGDKKNLHKILSWAVSNNLSVDSQLSITIPQLPFLTREQLEKVMPKVPKAFLPRKLFAIGMAKFKGDKMPVGWSVNDKFEKGKEYPVYDSEGLFVVGSDGKGYKMTPTAWTKVKSL